MSKKEPLVSVIMPAYNVENFIGRAIESVLKQSYRNIELVIGNDASTDRTCEIVEQFDDNRIKLFHEKQNTGSAYLPRQLALEHCTGEYVVNLDADDYLEHEYIRKLYNRLCECSADVCCGRMVIVDENGILSGDGRTIPGSGFDYSIQMTGREAYFATLPEWKIGMNGCMAKREAWEYGFRRTHKSGRRGIHDDENVSRYLLLWSKCVVFCEADHYYTVNQNSVTHLFNRRIFEFRDSEKELLKLVGEDYGKDSREYKVVEINNYFAFLVSLNHFVESSDSLTEDELSEYLKEFKNWHDGVNWAEVYGYINKKHYLAIRNFYLGTLLYMFRRGKCRTIVRIGKRSFRSCLAKCKNNSYYKWYCFRKQREKLFRKEITGKYNSRGDGKREYPCYVINVFDGTVQGGGLADRLRGIISTYAICKAHGLDYRLYFTYPFDMVQFFEPAEYDWRIDGSEICRNTKDCHIVILDATEDSAYQYRKQRQYLESHLKGVRKQTQVFTNAGYSYTVNYSELFRELFKPTERLRNAVNFQKEILGDDYISISARFLDLLGDFNETAGYGTELDEREARRLIEKSVDEIVKLHVRFPNRRILVNSDSIRFIHAADELAYTYIIPGNITHIDSGQFGSSYESYEKTFLDFLMIAEASEIFLIIGGKMHNSGYPYAASLIYSRPFHRVEFS